MYFLDISEQACVRAVNTVLLFDASSSGTPVNNPIKLVSPETIEFLRYICAADSFV